MSISNILRYEMEKSCGSVRVVKVPKERRPTAESLYKLEHRISAQIDENYAYRYRSMKKAWFK